MEQFVLGIFQEQLSKIIVGFRKEQVNANLLNGKGEIHNVELNCSLLNEELGRIAPFIEFEKVHISKINFHVTSWTNLRKAPIVIDIEHIRARAVEPFRFLDKSLRKDIQQIMKSELPRLIKEGLAPKYGGYGIFHRIMDNLTIEIASVAFEYQTAGKFKTRRLGKWSPPEIQLRLAGIRLVSVGEYGQEGSPDEVWQHNHRRGIQNFLLYKKLSLEYQIYLKPYDADPIPLLTKEDNRLEIQLATERRIKDGAFLKLQVDATIPSIEIDIPSHVVPILAQAVAGLTFCLAKDRAFVDPLKRNDQYEDVNSSCGVDFSDDDQSDILSCGPDEIPKEPQIESVSSSDTDEVDDIKHASSDEKDTVVQTKASVSPSADSSDRPIILMPNGLVIEEKVSISVSIHCATIRGTYARDGYVQLEAKGMVTELIWPRENKEKGGYAQASISYVSVTERSGKKSHPLLIGGVQYDTSGPIEQPAKPLSAVGRDVTFPLYEDRSIRPDPLWLRHTFPAQAFGIKTTAEFIKKVSGAGNVSRLETDDVAAEDVRFINEVGIEQFKIVADAYAWTRILRFALNIESGGFEERWYTGDWTDSLTTDMLLQPNEPLNLNEHLQPTKQIFLDDNFFVSSDLFNATARISDVVIRTPAAIDSDLRSCDVIFKFDELMLVVSSALPRTFLSGKVGSAVFGEGSNEKCQIDFPNDPTDVVYQIENTEDPSDRQRGFKTSQHISTFRMQVTLRRYSLCLEPIVPFCTIQEPKLLIAPSELTFLLCFEGEPPATPSGNLINLVLIVSGQIHKFEVNLDLDLFCSAIGTATYQLAAGRELAEQLSSFLGPAETEHTDHTGSSITRLRRGIRGSRASVKRHIQRSRVTSSVRIAAAIQIAECRFCLWRLNIPTQTALRPNLNITTSHEQITHVPFLKICTYEMYALETGLESVLQGTKRRIVYKACLSRIVLKALSSNAISEQAKQLGVGEVVEVASLGDLQNDEALSLRIEDQFHDSLRTTAFAADMQRGCASLRILDLESFVLLVLEALLVPTSAKNHIMSTPADDGSFPLGTVGAFLKGCFPEASGLDRLEDSASWIPNILDDDFLDHDRGDFLKMALYRLLPSDVDTFLFRLGMSNCRFHISGSERDVRGDFHEGEILLSYDTSNTGFFPLADTLCRRGTTWTYVLPGYQQGLWCRLTSKQGLSFSNPSNEVMEVIRPFTFSILYEMSKLNVSMPDGIAFDLLTESDSPFSVLRGFWDQCKSVSSNAAKIIHAIKRPIGARKPDSKANVHIDESPVALACLDSAICIQSAVDLIRQLAEKTYSYHKTVDRQIQGLDWDNQELKKMVFQKEKDRLAVLAMLSFQTSGWLRLGAAQRTGQRGLFSSTLWPQWAVLRRSLLVIYKNPGTYQPCDIIFLRGANLIELQGGQRKRDVKRAFALTDCEGTIYLVSTGNDREHHEWIQKLKAAILSCTSCSESDELNDHGELKQNMLEKPKDFPHKQNDITSSPDRITIENKHGLAIEKTRKGNRSEAANPIDREPLSSDVMGIGNGSVETAGKACLTCTFVNASEMAYCEMCGSTFTGYDEDAVNANISSIEDQEIQGKADHALEAAKRQFGLTEEEARQQSEGFDKTKKFQDEHLSTTATALSPSTAGQRQGIRARIGSAARLFSGVASNASDDELFADSIDTPPRRILGGSNHSNNGKAAEFDPAEAPRRARGRLSAALWRKDSIETIDNDVQKINPGASRGRFLFRGTKGAVNETPSTPSGALCPVELKNVSFVGNVRLPPHPLGIINDTPTEVPLKRLEGNWSLRVKTGTKNRMPTEGENAIPPMKIEESFDSSNSNPEGSVVDGGNIRSDVEDPGKTIQPGYAEKLGSETIFHITVLRYREGGEPAIVTEFFKRVADILSLHTAISEALTKLSYNSVFSNRSGAKRLPSGDMSNELSNLLELDTVEVFRISAGLLGGLLEYTLKTGGKLPCHASDTVADFLSAMLTIPLPVDALGHLAEFLNLSEVSTENGGGSYALKSSLETTPFDEPEERQAAADLALLLSLIETQLLRAQNQNYLSEELAREAHLRARLSESIEIPTSYFSYTNISTRYQDAVHAALMQAMEERDEAHSRLVASNVLHVHEMEQQRKKLAHLSLQLEEVKNDKNDGSAKYSDLLETQSRKAQRIMQQNTEEELVSLCQQLSSEISARTAAELEVARLKESRQIERQNELVETNALREEIETLKKQLSVEKSKTKAALDESLNWKKYVQDVVQASKIGIPR